MDYKVACVLALMIASAVSVPYKPPVEVSKVEIESEQSAPKCPCSKIYFPMCGSDGKSYNNICEFNCQARHVRNLYVVAETRCEEIE